MVGQPGLGILKAVAAGSRSVVVGIRLVAGSLPLAAAADNQPDIVGQPMGILHLAAAAVVSKRVAADLPPGCCYQVLDRAAAPNLCI